MQPAGSPGANSRASQFSGAIGVTQLRELMDNDEDDAVSHSQSHASDYSHLSRGLPTKAKYKDKMSNNPRAAMVDYSLSPSSTSPADHASKRVAKVEPRPPSPPNVIVEIDRMVSARQAVEKRGVGLIFIDAKKPTPIEVPKVSEERAPVRAQAAMIVDVASSEDQLLLQEQKRIQRKMQQKVSSLEQRNRERSRSRGRGYGMRGGTAIEEDGVKPAPIDSIVDPLTDNAPSGYEDRAVRRQKPLEVHGVDDSRSMFSADAPSAVTRRGRITAITAHRPEDSGLPDLPAAVAGSRGDLLK